MTIRTTFVYLALSTLGIASFVSAEALEPSAAIPIEAGAGLDAAFWALPAKSLKSLAREGLQVIREKPANASFSATTLQYAGNDLLKLEEWLGEDSASLLYQEEPKSNVMGDALLRFAGYIAIPAAGEVTFTSVSDDGSIVWIGGQKIIHNDGYGAAPGDFPDGTALFASAGIYPIEIAFFNGDWTDEAGNHGESIIRFFVDGEPVKEGALYSVHVLGDAVDFPSNPLTESIGEKLASSL